jgi:hypothetical protein
MLSLLFKHLLIPLLALLLGSCDYLFHLGFRENFGVLIFKGSSIGTHHNHDALLSVEA